VAMRDFETEKSDYLEYLQHQRNFSKNTVISYEYALRSLGEFLKKRGIGHDFMGQLSRPFFRDFLISLKREGLKPSSIAHRVFALKSFFKHLVRRGYAKTDPGSFLQTPKRRRNTPSYFTIAQTEELLGRPSREDLSGLRDLAILELFYSTGIRLSELCELKLSSMDSKGEVIRVMGKGKKERIVPVGAEALKALQSYLDRRKLSFAKMSETDDDALFWNRFGKRLSSRSVRRIVKKHARQVSEEKGSGPHTLRHTFATHLLDQGANLLTIKELLGHESLSTTQIYTHLTTEKLKKIYKKAHPRAEK
jgi:integrase/recombinase XerC